MAHHLLYRLRPDACQPLRRPPHTSRNAVQFQGNLLGIDEICIYTGREKRYPAHGFRPGRILLRQFPHPLGLSGIQDERGTFPRRQQHYRPAGTVWYGGSTHSFRGRKIRTPIRGTPFQLYRKYYHDSLVDIALYLPEQLYRNHYGYHNHRHRHAVHTDK